METEICKKLKEKYKNTDKRFLGIDYGIKNIGIAISDTSRFIATPLITIPNNPKETMGKLQTIIDENNISVIVIGLPLLMNGQVGDMAEKVKSFGKLLKQNFLNLDICYFDERLTSKKVENMLIKTFDLSREKRKKILDKMAAAEILQSVLDL